MKEEHDKNLKPLIDTYDRINSILRNEPIEVPKIVVVGDQSSGKSSVLESITGITLPRGQNTVTKCPLIIQSRSCNKIEDEFLEISVENILEPKKFSIKEISTKILEVQNAVLRRQNTEISDIPITIKIQTMNSPDLTLYDLPGITYKNENISDKVKKIIAKYTQGSNTIILLILPANSDLTTTQAIELVRKNNDFKDRTMSIITKIDLGTLEKGLYDKIILNELQLSFNPIVVKNRTQEEIEKNIPIEEIKAKELEIINNSELRSLPEDSKGIDMLVKKLVELQKDKLISSKFRIKDEINTKLNQIKEEIRNLPPSFNGEEGKIIHFNKMVRTFKQTYINQLKNINISDRNGFINLKFQEQFDKLSNYFAKMQNTLLEDKYFNELQEKVKDESALKLKNLIGMDFFNSEMRKLIALTEKHVDEIINSIDEYFSGILKQIINQCFNQFFPLEDSIQNLFEDCVRNQKEKVRDKINDLLTMEKEICFTNLNYYSDVVSKLSQFKENAKQTMDNRNLFATNNNNSNSNTNTSLFGSNKPNTNSSANTAEYKINEFTIKPSYLDKRLFNCTTNTEFNTQTYVFSIFAYFNVFSKRFLDYFNLTMMFHYLKYFETEFNHKIETEFIPFKHNNSYKWIEESKEIRDKRAKLIKSRDLLEEAYKEIRNII